jgi:hypothetical protein
MSLTKTLLTAITLMASATAVNAQSCKFDVDKTDGVSHMHVRSVKYNIGSPSSQWVVTMEQKGPKYYMTFQLHSNEHLTGKFPKGQEVLLKQDNGRPIVFFNPSDVVPTHTNGGSTWVSKIEVTAENLAAVNALPVTEIYTSFLTKGFSSPRLTVDETRKIQQTAQCLIN